MFIKYKLLKIKVYLKNNSLIINIFNNYIKEF